MKLMQKSIFCKYVGIYQTIHYDLTKKKKKDSEVAIGFSLIFVVNVDANIQYWWKTNS